MNNLIFPVRNLHGTPSSELSEAILNVRRGVRQMLSALEQASPNGRDYYPQGDGALRKAVEEHACCCKAMTLVADELLALASEPHPGEEVEQKIDAALATLPQKPSVTPTVHINGTSASALKSAGIAVFRASQTVDEAFRQVVPNMRDYSESEAWVKARQQHVARVAAAKVVGGYYLQIAIACRQHELAPADS